MKKPISFFWSSADEKSSNVIFYGGFTQSIKAMSFEAEAIHKVISLGSGTNHEINKARKELEEVFFYLYEFFGISKDEFGITGEKINEFRRQFRFFEKVGDEGLILLLVDVCSVLFMFDCVAMNFTHRELMGKFQDALEHV